MRYERRPKEHTLDLVGVEVGNVASGSIRVMRDKFIRFSGPIVVVVVEAGLQVSGIQNFYVALVLWMIACTWVVAAVVTWQPIRRRIIFAAIGRPTLREQRAQTVPTLTLAETLQQGRELLGNGDPDIYEKWVLYTSPLVASEFGPEQESWFVGNEGFGEAGTAARVGRLSTLLQSDNRKAFHHDQPIVRHSAKRRAR